MGSKGRVPPHPRYPLPGPGMIHPEHFTPGVQPTPGGFPPFEILPPPEVMEQKLAAQHVEMQKLATENQRLAATHGILRQELGAAQHELQIVHAHIGAMKSEREQQMRGFLDKIAKMEADLQAAEPIKIDLQQAQKNAQGLMAARQGLISEVQQLTEGLQKAHSDVQKIPALMSDLESLRQEYHRCRATYDYEKKLYNDHLESLQVMEKNYVTMAREVEKLRAELTNSANIDIRAGGPYGGTTRYNENEATGHYHVGQNAYTEGYVVPQGRVVLPGDGGGPVAGSGGGTPSHVGAQPGSLPASAGYEASRGPSYDAQQGISGSSYDTQRGPGGQGNDTQGGPVGQPGFNTQRAPGYDARKGHGYDGQRGHGYEMQRGPRFDARKGAGYEMQGGSNYDPQRGPVYDSQRVPGYDSLRVLGYDGQRGPNYDMPKSESYGASSRGGFAPQGRVEPANNASYGYATPPSHAASDYNTTARGANPAKR